MIASFAHIKSLLVLLRRTAAN